jgi:glycogen synthase
VKILVITNLYPPHHAGTFDLRCEAVVNNLKLRGHTVRVLTSTHGMLAAQQGGEVERRLALNGLHHHDHRGLRAGRGAGLQPVRPVEVAALRAAPLRCAHGL